MFAAAMASRREPAPESFVLETVKTTALSKVEVSKPNTHRSMKKLVKIQEPEREFFLGSEAKTIFINTINGMHHRSSTIPIHLVLNKCRPITLKNM